MRGESPEPAAATGADEGPPPKVARTTAETPGGEPRSASSASSDALATAAPAPVAELFSEGIAQAHRREVMLRWAAQVKAYVDLELVKFLKERQSKVSLPVRSQVLLMPALEIKNAASGAKLL